MRKSLLVIIALCWATISLQPSAAPLTATQQALQTVETYISLDLGGATLSSEGFKRCAHLFEQQEGSGWDSLYIVGGHKITGYEKQKNQILVQVSFDLIGRMDGETIDFSPVTKTAVYRVNQTGNKLTRPEIPPHVSLAALESHLSNNPHLAAAHQAVFAYLQGHKTE